MKNNYKRIPWFLMCPNCGASGTKKSNEVINCKYCGTPL